MNDRLPAGTVTFLFTDMQGSTTYWEQMPDDMQISLAQHHAIIRAAIETNGGQVYQIIGDEFQAAFRLAPQALDAALAAQRGLRDAQWGKTGPLKVRMGLHTGPAEPDPKGDAPYAVSHTLNRAGRIRSSAHGGQILLSKEAADLVERQLPAGVALKDMGEHHFKNMQRPEHLYQVVAPDLPQTFPPVAALDARRGNLPIQLTSFIGREKELAEVRGLLDRRRLVTLTGSGGTGKTRLSLEAAAAAVDAYPDGAWLVELAPLADPDKVAQLIIITFGLHDSGSRTQIELLADYLADKTLLLILDNCEHLLEACALLADRLLRDCPRLTILASSREALGLAGEDAYRVPSLAAPDPRQPQPLRDLLRFESVRLFAERAGAVEQDFVLTEANAPAVAQLCHRLDGIPLAIELAAARVGLLTVEQIAARLDNRFRLLTGGSRTALPRQQTLRASIDWSYSLLSEKERLLLMRLSVFVGGWTLEAAEAVCGFDGLDADEVLDGLDGLVKKSLVAAGSQAGSEMRYHLLETIRQYAREKLLDNEAGETVRSRHLDYYLHLAEQAEPHLRSHEQVAWNDWLEAEGDNLRSAMQWSQEEQFEKGMRIAWALRWFWHERGHIYRAEVANFLDRVLSTHKMPMHAPEEQVRIWARANTEQAFLLSISGNNKAKINDLYEMGLTLFEALGPEGRHELVFLYMWWGFYWSNVRLNQVRSQEMMQKSLHVAEELGDLFGIAEAIPWANRANELTQNIHMIERALELRRQIGDQEGIWWEVLHLTILYRARGDFDQALILSDEGLEIAQLVKNIWGQGLHMYHRGMLYVEMGRFSEAITWMELAMERFRETGNHFMSVSFEIGYASVLQKRGDRNAAENHLYQAFALAGKGKFSNEQGIILFCRGEIAWAGGDTALAEQHYKEVLSLGQDIQSGISSFGLYGLGKIALSRGVWPVAWSYFHQAIYTWREVFIPDYIPDVLKAAAVLTVAQEQDRQLSVSAARDAVRLYGAGLKLGYLHHMNFMLQPHFEPYDMEACLASAREALGEEGYQQAFAEGQAMTLEQAVTLAMGEP